VFVSYAHADFAYVHRLVAWLRQRRVDAWVDDDIERGARWEFGRTISTSFPFGGAIDDVHVYQGVLNDREIAASYAGN
jgi:hypothetical protein